MPGAAELLYRLNNEPAGTRAQGVEAAPAVGEVPAGSPVPVHPCGQSVAITWGLAELDESVVAAVIGRRRLEKSPASSRPTRSCAGIANWWLALAGPIQCRERVGGVLNYYYRDAA